MLSCIYSEQWLTYSNQLHYHHSLESTLVKTATTVAAIIILTDMWHSTLTTYHLFHSTFNCNPALINLENCLQQNIPHYVHQVSGLFVPWTIHTMGGLFVPWMIRTMDYSYVGLFVWWTICTTDYSYYGLLVLFTNITYANKANVYMGVCLSHCQHCVHVLKW